MDRRRYLQVAAGAAAAGLAGCGGLTGGSGQSDDPSDSDGTSGATTSSSATRTEVDPITVRTLDAKGSSAGEITLPLDGRVTVIDMFATWCAPCKPTLDTLVEARGRLDGDVRFVSVTAEQLDEEFTAGDVAAWWANHGGEWTVAHDEGGLLTRVLEASGLPTTVVTDPARQVVWHHTGIPRTDAVVEHVGNARA